MTRRSDGLRFLYFTDSHIRGTNPKSRKDNFLETSKAKLEEVLEITRDREVDYVLHGGDFFDRPDVSISVINDLADVLNAFEVPIYIISGNHDIYGHNPKTLHRTVLGLLDSLGILKIINYQDLILEKDGVTVQVTGTPYVYDIDRRGREDMYVLDHVDPRADYAIHLVHGFLMDKKFLDEVPHTLISEIKHTKADLTISGHYHNGFKTQEIEGKLFTNPGAIVRVSNSMIEMKRRPKVLIIDADREGLHLEEVYLKTAKPGPEVLDREVIEGHKHKRAQLGEFKEIVNSSGSFERLNLQDLVMDIAQAGKVDKEVREEALDRIAQAQMEDGLR